MLGIPINHRVRRSPREPEFSAGVIFDFDDAGTTNCLIRDTSPQGAQLRISQDRAVAPGSWLINLRTCVAAELVPVWRRPSLMGVKFALVHAIDETLPSRLERLMPVLSQAKQSFSLRVAANGILTREQQQSLAVSYSSWGMI